MTSSMLLRRKVLEELRLELGPDAATIDASVQDGEVTLTGSIPSYDASRLADRAAKRVPGVESVIDELTLAPPERPRFQR